MLQAENIKKGFASIDNRPVVVWEGQSDTKLGTIFRLVLTRKNSLVVEIQSPIKNAMEQHTWSKTSDHETDAGFLARVLFDTMRELHTQLVKDAS